MMRFLLGSLLVLVGVLGSWSAADAEEFQLAKVYRDYPGYISPPVCENPRLSSSSVERARHSAGTEKQRLLPAGRFYLGGWVGLATLQSEDLETEHADLSVDYDSGYGLGLLAGYDFGLLRLEIEGNTRQLDIDPAEGNSSGDTITDGEVEISSVLLNAYADIPTGSYITPYVGIGVGYASVDLQDLNQQGSRLVDDDDQVLCGQAAAGFDFMLNERTSLDVGYRFLVASSPEFKTEAGDEVETDILSHTVSVGLKFLF